MQVTVPITHLNEMTMKLFLTLIFFVISVHANDRRAEQSFWEIYTEALRGSAKAQFNTGVIFERGLGAEKNEAKALEWYEKSAEQGYLDAQYNLALMYLSGRGTEVNEVLGEKWLREAIKQGDKEAIKLLEKLKSQKSARALQENGDNSIPIEPVTLILQNTALICEKASKQSECRSYPKGLAVTSRMKKGDFFKISGMGSTKGWQPYTDEGWVHQDDVKKRDGQTKPISSIQSSGEKEITPVTLIVTKRAKVCQSIDLEEQCSYYQAGSVVTSKMMSNEFYKISGIGTKQGWQPLELPRWIHMDDVEKRQ